MFEFKRLHSEKSESESSRPDLALPQPSNAVCSDTQESDPAQQGFSLPQQGYVRENQGPYTAPQGYAAPQQVYVVTSQQQVKWPRLQFLQPMKGLQFLEKKRFCGLDCDILKMCVRRKLRAYDEDAKYIGHSEAPYFCNLCSNLQVVNLEVPDGNHVLQTKKHIPFCKYWFPHLFCLCNMCKDITVMKILSTDLQPVGSFEYSPRFCRHECCVHGTYLIKDATGTKRFIIKKKCCLMLDIMWRNYGSCENCGKDECDLWWCGPSWDPVNLCNDWNVPIKILRAGNEEHMATIRMLRRPYLYEVFCCPKARYYVEYEDANETVENKALVLGTALAMDHNKLNHSLTNNANLRIPDHLRSTVIQE